MAWHGMARQGSAAHLSQHSRGRGDPTSVTALPGPVWGAPRRSGSGAAQPPFITALSCTRRGDAAGKRPGPIHVASFPLITTHRRPPAPSADPRVLAAERCRSIRVDGPAPPAPAPSHTPPSLVGPSIPGSRGRPGGLCATEGAARDPAQGRATASAGGAVSLSPRFGGAAGTPRAQDHSLHGVVGGGDRLSPCPILPVDVVPPCWAQLGDKDGTPDPLWGGRWDLAGGLQPRGHAGSLRATCLPRAVVVLHCSRTH